VDFGQKAPTPPPGRTSKNLTGQSKGLLHTLFSVVVCWVVFFFFSFKRDELNLTADFSAAEHTEAFIPAHILEENFSFY